MVAHVAQAHAIHPQLGGRQFPLQLGGSRGKTAHQTLRPRSQRPCLLSARVWEDVNCPLGEIRERR